MPEGTLPVENQPEPEVIEMEIAGAKFSGTKDEVIEKLARSVEHGTMTIKAQKDATRELTQLVEQLKRPAIPVGQNGYDHNKYLELLSKDGVAAADYLDEQRYGESRQQLQAKWNKSIETANDVIQMREINRFHQAATDFPGTPEASETLLRHLESNNMPVTAANMALAYGELRASGAIKPAVEKPEEEQPRGRKPPPSARGGSGGASGGKAPENMTLEELRATINKGGMGRQ